MGKYVYFGDILQALSEAIRPAIRMSVSEAAATYRYLNNPGSYIGPWKNEKTPYLCEPMDTLAMTDEYTGMVFVGPARTGKSDMFFNYLTYGQVCDPADMLLIHMTRSTARDWSQNDLAKAFRHTKPLGERLIPGRQNDNVHDKKFMTGTNLLIKWPTVTELSGKTYPRVWFMDYDRMPIDIGGEGGAYDLGAKRTTTFRDHAMTVAESSPGFDITDPKWRPASAHEGPPVEGGVVPLYNRGDRRRFYWCCANPKCRHKFEALFSHFSWPDSADDLEAAGYTTLDCPQCGYSHEHDPGAGQPGKDELNYNGKWIKDGQLWLPDGTVTGEARRAKLATFWLKGPAAAFTTWPDLVLKYIKAEREYRDTGRTHALKVTINTDHGEVFKEPSLHEERLPETLKERARNIGEKVIPYGVRFITAAIDVQKSAFIIQVLGYYANGDYVVIDRFDVRHSKRKDPTDDTQFMRVNPASYVEDWKLLIPAIIEKSYPLEDGSGFMGLKVIGCDSGGKDGVTGKAYEFWRYLKNEHGGNHHRRFQLIKGTGNEAAPRVSINYPDATRKDRHAGAKGEIPVMMINTNMLKDEVNGILGRSEEGGMMLFADWLPMWFYNELTAEVKTHKGWENPKRLRNEAWDLCVYNLALAISLRHVGIERINWERPPSWADVWERNSLVWVPVNDNEAQTSKSEAEENDDAIKKLAESLG